MGREARRVPLDFDWPQGKVWEGYLMPESLHGDKCPDCALGSTDAAEWVLGIAYLLSELSDDHLKQAQGREMHPYAATMRNISYIHQREGVEARPGPGFQEFVTGLMNAAETDLDDRRRAFGETDLYSVYRGLLKIAGLPEGWDMCKTCEGHSTVESYPGQRADAEAWMPTEPPTGEGWQMWETTSEGSPMSPVFDTPTKLASWLARTGASVFGNHTLDEAGWLRQITGEDFGYRDPNIPGAIFL